MRPLLAIGAAMLAMSAAAPAQAPTEKGRLGIALTDITKPWTGDLSGMVERRMVRVLTTYSKTQYFIDKGTPRGTAYDTFSGLNRTPFSRQACQYVPGGFGRSVID